MRAAVFEGPEEIVVQDVPDPICKPDGIVIQVHACGICGSDVRNFRTGLKGEVKHQVMGHEFTGEIVQRGRETDSFAVGDKIAIAPDVSCGHCVYCKRGWVNLCLNHRMIGTHWPGGFAEYAEYSGDVLIRGMIHRVPEGVSLHDAALSEPASSVIASQERACVGLGDTVLIFGDGPIGCLHLEVARARGAAKIIMVGLLRLADAARFEPDALLDARIDDSVRAVHELTNGVGADIAICANPVASTQTKAVESVRKRGRVILFGELPKNDPMTHLNSNLIHYNELSVVGAFSYQARSHQQALLSIKAGQITPSKYFNKVVTLEHINEGFQAAMTGEALKVLVKP